MSDFLDKLKNIKSNSKEVNIDEEAKIELLLFLKSRIDFIQGKNDLRYKVQKVLGDKLDKILEATEEDGENIEDMNPLILIRLLEVLNKSESEETASILGVLKQQINIQQNNFGSGLPLPLSKTEKDITNDINSNDVKTAKKFMEILNKIDIENGDEKI